MPPRTALDHLVPIKTPSFYLEARALLESDHDPNRVLATMFLSRLEIYFFVNSRLLVGGERAVAGVTGADAIAPDGAGVGADGIALVLSTRPTPAPLACFRFADPNLQQMPPALLRFHIRSITV